MPSGGPRARLAVDARHGGSIVVDVFEAIAGGDADAVERLVAAEPSVARSTNDQGVSAVLWALYVGRPAVARRLAEVEGGRPLDVFEVAALDRTGELEALLSNRADALGGRSADGFTPLHLAVFFGAAGSARILLDHGADVEAVADNESRVRPLHSAVAGGHAEIVEMLLERGADPNATQRGGFTPLHAARQRDDRAMIDALLTAGADPTVPMPEVPT
jgi:ankyrin repeat protein